MTTTKEVIKALKISDIVMEDITIGTKKSSKTVPILLKNKSIVLQTPFLEISGSLRKTSYPNIYQLDTLFKGDSKRKINQWYDFIENLENHITNLIIRNGSKWFTQKNVVIKSLIKELEPNKGNYFIKWPIDLKTNIFVDEYKKTYNPLELKEKDLVKLIVEIANLWIHDNQCGLAIVVQKILVKPYLEKIQSEYIFDDSESENSYEDDKDNNIISLLATEQKTKLTKQNDQINQALHNNSSLNFHNDLIQQKKQNDHQKIMQINNNADFDDPKNTKLKLKLKNEHIKDNQTKGTQKQDKLSNETNEISKNSDHNNSKKIQSSKIFNKDIYPFQKKQISTFKEVFSDISDENNFDLDNRINNRRNNKQNGMVEQLIDQYSSSSNETAEINDEDLEFD